LERAVRGLDPLERTGRNDRAVVGSHSGQDHLLPTAERRVARAALVQPRAVVAEDGEAKELVRVRQPVTGLLAAGVAAGCAILQGGTRSGALALGSALRASLRPALRAEEFRRRPVSGQSVREYNVRDEAVRVCGVSNRAGGVRSRQRGRGTSHRCRRDQRAVRRQQRLPSRGH
jgi:hypothetical protein